MLESLLHFDCIISHSKLKHMENLCLTHFYTLITVKSSRTKNGMLECDNIPNALTPSLEYVCSSSIGLCLRQFLQAHIWAIRAEWFISVDSLLVSVKSTFLLSFPMCSENDWTVQVLTQLLLNTFRRLNSSIMIEDCHWSRRKNSFISWSRYTPLVEVNQAITSLVV